MTDICRIPDKFESVTIISGIDFEIDTKGLCCEVCPRGGDITLRIPEKPGYVTLGENEKFNFCGKLTYRQASGDVTVECFYYHTL